MARNRTVRRFVARLRLVCSDLIRRARVALMQLDNPSQPLPLKLRIAAFVVAAVLALSLLELWAGGIRFMKLVAHVTQQIAEQEAAKAPPTPPKAAEAPAETPGVVSVGIVPEPRRAQ